MQTTKLFLDTEPEPIQDHKYVLSNISGHKKPVLQERPSIQHQNIHSVLWVVYV